MSPSWRHDRLSKCNLTEIKCGVYPSSAQESLSGSGNKHSGMLCRPDVQALKWHVGAERENPSPWNQHVPRLATFFVQMWWESPLLLAAICPHFLDVCYYWLKDEERGSFERNNSDRQVEKQCLSSVFIYLFLPEDQKLLLVYLFH